MPAMLVVLGVLALIAVLCIGGLVYAGYKVKQKATALLHSATPDEATPGAPSAPPSESKPGSPATSPSDDAGGLLDGLSKVLDGGDDEGDPVQPVNDATPVEPCAPAPFPPQSRSEDPLAGRNSGHYGLGPQKRRCREPNQHQFHHPRFIC